MSYMAEGAPMLWYESTLLHVALHTSHTSLPLLVKYISDAPAMASHHSSSTTTSTTIHQSQHHQTTPPVSSNKTALPLAHETYRRTNSSPS